MENSCLVLIHLDPFISISASERKSVHFIFPCSVSGVLSDFFISIINREIFQIEKKLFLCFWGKKKNMVTTEYVFPNGVSTFHFHHMSLFLHAMDFDFMAAHYQACSCQIWTIYQLLKGTVKLLHYRDALLQAKSIYFLSRCLLRTLLLHTKLHLVLVGMVGVTVIKKVGRLCLIIKYLCIFVCLSCQ